MAPQLNPIPTHPTYATARIPLSAEGLASAILTGQLPASAAIGRADAYDALNRGSDGPLPFLGSSSKIDAGRAVGILTRVLYMQPARASGREACPHRSPGCTAACLAEETGHMSMPGSQRARRRRHASFFADRARFLADIHAELTRHEAHARRIGMRPAARLNGTTDLPWHRLAFTAHDGTRYASLHVACPGIAFYEYTKIPLAVQARGGLPANLSLTFSVSERPDADARALEYLHAGHGAAVVAAMPKHAGPSVWQLCDQLWPTVDGDAHDARFLDPAASIVLLSAKGRAKRDRTGFVRSI